MVDVVRQLQMAIPDLDRLLHHALHLGHERGEVSDGFLGDDAEHGLVGGFEPCDNSPLGKMVHCHNPYERTVILVLLV
jgi:hypothetical protein